jgi:protein gp37
MIFVNSMSDLFHPTVDFKYIAAVFGVMWACPQHIFQVLTKHPERAAAFFRWLRGAVGKNLTTGGRCVIETDPLTGCQIEAGRHVKLGGYTISSERGKRPVSERSLTWPLPNVWLGTSVENAEVEGRIADLMACEAAVRWVSYEPALGMVDYSKHLREPGWWCERCGTTKSPQQVTHGETCTLCSEAVEWRESLDWIVIGGESGCGARPFNVSWAAGLLEAGKAAGVPVFVKQLGSRPFIGLADMPGRATVDGPTERAWPVALDEIEHPLSPPVRAWRPKLKHPKGGNWDEWPEWLRVREYPASAAALSEVA